MRVCLLWLLIATSAPQVQWSGTAGGAEVSWTAQRLTLTAAGKETFREELTSKQAQGCLESFSESEALSLVGPYFSWWNASGADCGGAHPSCGTVANTVDARTGKPVSVLELFGDKAVLGALRRDPYLGPVDAGALDFEDLVQKAANGKGRLLSPTAFYVHHVEQRAVAVRLILTSTSHAECGAREELGLLLPVPATLRESISKAQQGVEGFLRKNRPAASRWGRRIESAQNPP